MYGIPDDHKRTINMTLMSQGLDRVSPHITHTHNFIAWDHLVNKLDFPFHQIIIYIIYFDKALTIVFTCK